MNRLWRTVSLAVVSVCALASVGCGGIAVVDPMPEDDGTTTTTSSTTTTTATGMLDVTIDSVIASANCQPSVPPDPLLMSFDLIASNTESGSASVEIDAARLDSILGSLSFEVTPSSFTIPGNGQSEIAVDKVPSSGVGLNACDLCNANTPQLDLELTVDLLVNGGSQSVTRPVSSISCVF
jgi:hypothetical protein